MTHIMDSMKYLMAALEADLYLEKKNHKEPYADLMTLLAKLGIKSAMLDNRPLHMQGFRDMLVDRQLYGQFKKPCKACPTKKCKSCPHRKPT